MPSSDREPLFPFVAARLLTRTASVEVTLQSMDGLDDFSERKFVVSPSTTVPIGRSSKNHSKKLMSGSDNAFIDSPVISREHARFSASNAMGIPTVYLTDNGSMHGTLVNSKPLPRNQAHRLHNGDILQFGTNVVRDQGKPHHPLTAQLHSDPATLDSFTAKKFRFHSQIAPTLSHGFTVPDPGDSEEEEIDNDEPAHPSSPRAASYGSQTNPVNIDDFEDIPQEIIDLEADAASPEPSSPEAKGSGIERADSPPTTTYIRFPDQVEQVEQVEQLSQLSQLPLVGDDESESDQENIYGTEKEEVNNYGLKSGSLAPADEDDEEDSEVDIDIDYQDEDNASNLSQAGSMDDSNIDTDSESGESDDEDPDAVPRLKMAQMLNYEHIKLANDENPASSTNAFSSPHTIQATSKSQGMLYSSPAIGLTNTVSPQDIQKQPEMVPNNIFHQPIHQPFQGATWDPLPPRPTAPKAFWGPPGPDAHGTFLRGELNHFSPYPSHFAGNSYHQRMDYLGQVLNSEPISAPPPPPPPVLAMRPPTPPVPTSNEFVPITPQTNRRNGVSIPELVEETPQQPPTPTSVDTPKNLKRKADTLEEEEDAEVEVATNEAPRDVEVVVPEADSANTEAPPAKRRRTALATVATNTASFIAGAVFAVGALVMLPEVAFS